MNKQSVILLLLFSICVALALGVTCGLLDQCQTYKEEIESLNAQIDILVDDNLILKEDNELLKSMLSEKQSEVLIGMADLTWYSEGNITASGTKPVEGYTLAVTRGQVPKGSWLKIVLPDGTEYIRRADDITGKKGDSLSSNGLLVDIYTNDHNKAIQNGRVKDVKVYLLEGVK